jgi:hypothetical protein
MTDSDYRSRLVHLFVVTMVGVLILSPIAAGVGPSPLGTASASDGIHYVTDSGFEIEDTSGGSALPSFPDDNTLDLPGINLSSSGTAFVTLDQRTGPFTNLTNVDDSPTVTINPDDKQEFALMGSLDSLNVTTANYTAANTSVDLVYSTNQSSEATVRLESTGLPVDEPVNAVDVDTGAVLDTTTVASNGSVTFGALDSGSHTVNLKTEAPTISAFTLANPSSQDLALSLESDKQLTTLNATLSGPESTAFGISDFTETQSGGTYTYKVDYAGSNDGKFTATLDNATDEVGNNGASGQSDSVTVDTVEFKRTNLAVEPDEILVGESVTVSLDIENVGDSSGYYGIAIEIDGERRFSEVRGKLSAGEQVRDSVALTLNETGEREIRVRGMTDTPKTQTVTVNPEPVANVSITDYSLNATSLSVNETLAVTATLENTGDAAGSLGVPLVVDDTTVDNTTVDVAANDTTTVTFAHTFDTTGEFDVTVGDLAATTVTVESDSVANVSITDYSLNATSLSVNETLAVTATLENTGDAAGNATVPLIIDNQTVQNDTVQVSPGKTQTVTVYRTFDAAGEYNVTVGDHPPTAVTVALAARLSVVNGSVTMTNEYESLDVAAIPDGEAAQGELVRLEATVTNTGNKTVSGHVGFQLEDGLVSGMIPVEKLGAGNTTDVFVAVRLGTVDPGSYTYRFAGPAGNTTGPIDVVRLGDVDHDGGISSGDVTQIQQEIVGLEPTGFYNPAAATLLRDDNERGPGDATYVQQLIVQRVDPPQIDTSIAESGSVP